MEKPQNRMENDYLNRLKGIPGKPLKMPDQDFKCVTCPNCGSAQVRITKTESFSNKTVIRHHSCKLCPATWKTLQTKPLIDQQVPQDTI